ncbi:MAG: SDR family oxidoreductase [Bacteroidetes bacterium]|nr:SDR family oxidoreductase [Bacteroidota bacterium]
MATFLFLTGFYNFQGKNNEIMDLQLKDTNIIVCGATSGFGRGTLEALIEEGARVYAVARTPEKLNELQLKHSAIRVIAGDISRSDIQDKLLSQLQGKHIHGALINAGGPPAKSAEETNLEVWDEAYKMVMRWKIEFTMKLLPFLKKQQFGRMLYVESSSIKQPIENLVLSTSFRMGITGYIKTLAQELVDSGITFNIMAPGFHQTAAVDRIVENKAKKRNSSYDETLNDMIQQLPMKKMGNPDSFGKLAAWLFSPYADYITGQIIPVDGGVIKSSV